MRLEGGAGDDRLDGGAGSDTASYAGSLESVSVNLATGSAVGGDAEGDQLTSVENLIGSRYRDHLVGDAQSNTLEGGAGNDTLQGGAGADTYAFSSDADEDTIDNTGRSGDGDRILITEGVNERDIWFSQNGDDLQIDFIGDDNSITVRDWFIGEANRVDYLQLGEGEAASFLQSSNVQVLVDAMSRFDPPASSEQHDLTEQEQARIETVVATQWNNELVPA